MAYRLSARERGVVELLLQGKSNKQIALALGISARTVEFHLKNIYAKLHVSSRIELVLKLGNATGRTLEEKLGYSAVDRAGEKAENRDRLASTTSFRNAVSIVGKELEMRNLLNTKYVLVGIMTALLTGFSWIVLCVHYGNLTVEELQAWSVPLSLILTAIGGSVGLVGKRNHNTLRRVFFSVLFGTSLSLFTVLPVMLIVFIPLGNLAAQIGLIDPSAMPSHTATLVATISMIAIWLVAGIIIATILLFVTIKKPEGVNSHKPAAENGW